MSFASGLQAGLAMSNQWLDTYERAKRQNYMADVKQRADLGEYQSYAPEYGRGLEQKAAEVDAQGRPLWDISIQPGSTQYDVRPISYGETPAGPPQAPQPVFGGQGLVPQTDLMSPPPTRTLGEALPQPEMRTTYMGRQFAPGALNDVEKRALQQEEYANVYERLGNPEQAMAMRNAAAKERRDMEMFGLQKEAAQLQLGEAKRGIAQREAGQNLSMALSELEKNGQPLTSERILQVGAAYGLGPAEAGKVFVERNGVNQAIYENGKVVRAQLAQNVNTLGQAKMAFNNNPIFADGTEMDYTTTGDGRVVVMQKNKADGRVMFTSEPMTEGQAVAMLKQRMMDPIAAENFAMSVATHNMGLLKDKALINKYNSEARAAGVDTKNVSNMVSYQRSLQDQLEKLDAGLQALDPKSPAFAKEIDRRKQLSELLEVTNAKLATELNLGAPPPPPASYTKGARITRNGKTFELQGDNWQDPNSWKEVQGAPAAAAAPAPAGLGPEKTTAAPDNKKYIRERDPRTGGWSYTESPRGLTKQQYADNDAKNAARAAKAPAAATPAAPAASPTIRIPAPPPKMITGRGVAPYPNPAYADWERKYGASWNKLQGK